MLTLKKNLCLLSTAVILFGCAFAVNASQAPSCESIVVAKLLGPCEERTGDTSATQKIFIDKFLVTEVLKGPRTDTTICVRRADRKPSDGLEAVSTVDNPKIGTRFILFISQVNGTIQPYETFDGALGRVEFDDWFIEKLKKELRQQNVERP